MDGDLTAYGMWSKVTPSHIGFMMGWPDTSLNEDLKPAKILEMWIHLHIIEQTRFFDNFKNKSLFQTMIRDLKIPSKIERREVRWIRSEVSSKFIINKEEDD